MISIRQIEAGRIAYLDGLRGIAILLVVNYHVYVLWPDHLAFGDRFARNPLFNSQMAGVYLFFIISGFVILMTLNKCRSFGEFMLRRWYRLWPAMIMTAAIIMATAPLLPERPMGPIHALDFLPGLTFTGDMPFFWAPIEHALGMPIHAIEGSLWSLYIEIRFYLIFGLAYFAIGQRNALIVVLAIYVIGKEHLGSGFEAIAQHCPPGSFWATVFLDAGGATKSFALLTHGYLWIWFYIGCLFYLSWQRNDRRLYLIALTIGLVASGSGALFEHGAGWPWHWTFVLVILFALPLRLPWIARMLSNRVLLFFGVISYPLYLVHENIVVALTERLGRHYPELPAVLQPILPIACVVAISAVITFYLERPAKALLVWLTQFSRSHRSGVID